MPLAVRILSYRCTWEIWRALKKLELLSAGPRATLTHFSCSPNFPGASIIRYTHAKHEKILKFHSFLTGNVKTSKPSHEGYSEGQNNHLLTIYEEHFRAVNTIQ